MGLSTLVLDYGIAEPSRLLIAMERAGMDVQVSSAVFDVRMADRLVIPSGPDDGAALARGIQPGFLDAIRQHLVAGKPVLAIGLGVQLLLEGRAHPDMPQGLGVFGVPVAHFDSRMADENERPLKTPHVGFSLVVGLDRHPVFRELIPPEEVGLWLYFRHRLCAPARVPFAEVAVAHHGVPFAGCIWRDRVVAAQFLPELSGPVGVEFLRAWDRSNA